MAAPYRCRGGAPLGRARGRGGRGLGAAARLARQPRRLLVVARRRRGRLAAVQLGAARARGRGRAVRGGRGLAARARLAGQGARLGVRRRSRRLQLLQPSAAAALTNKLRTCECISYAGSFIYCAGLLRAPTHGRLVQLPCSVKPLLLDNCLVVLE